MRNFKRFSGKVIRQPRYSARVAVQRARAYLAYYMDNGFARAPEAITFFLTYRCNLRCRMCGQWGDVGTSKDRPGKTMERDISFTELKNIVDDIAFFRPNITLFGGEPLLHHHVPDLVRHIKHNGLHCLMITNGSLLGRHGDELIESGLDELNVSLDGAGKLHDEIRGVPGLYYRVIDGLRHIARMKEEKKLRTPLVNLQCTINRYNYRYLDQMIEVAKEVQADALTFHNLIFLSSGILDQQKPFDELLHCSSSGWKGFLFEPSIDPD
ncbi:MAG: radical SAM protein, partial [Nitrospiraceae bacterium]